MKLRNNHFCSAMPLSTTLLSIALTACGGGGGGSEPPPETTPAPNPIIDPPEELENTAAGVLNLLTSVSLEGINDPDALTFSPDGTEIAVASTSGNLRLLTVNIYNAATGELNRSLDNTSLITTTLNGTAISEIYWGSDNVISAEYFPGHIYWSSGGELIDDIELPVTNPCAAPFGLLHLFDPDTNTTYSSSGERLVNEPICIFNQSNQTISNSTINDTPGRISSALFDVTDDTIWINYLERENFEERVSVGTLEYNKSTLIATGESLNEGEALAITDTYRLIRDGSDFFIYPGALELAIRNDSLIADPTGKVAVGGVPTNTTQIRFISLDDATIIGDIPKDFGSRRVFSNDGTMVAVPYLDKIDVYDVTARTQNSALILGQ